MPLSPLYAVFIVPNAVPRFLSAVVRFTLVAATVPSNPPTPSPSTISAPKSSFFNPVITELT